MKPRIHEKSWALCTNSPTRRKRSHTLKEMKTVLFTLFAVGAFADSGPMKPDEIFPLRKNAVGPWSSKWNKFYEASRSKVGGEAAYIEYDAYYTWRMFKLAGDDVEKALALLDEALAFRKKYKLDTLRDDEGLTGRETKDTYDPRNDAQLKRFQVNFDMRDYETRSILYLNVGAWPLKTALGKGEGAEYEAALYRIMESGVLAQFSSIVYLMCKYNRFNVLVNFEGWTAAEGGSGCAECTALVTKVAKNILKIWPDQINAIGLLNTTPEVETWFGSMESVLPLELQKRVYIYGRNQNEWLPKVEALLGDDYKKDLQRWLKNPKNYNCRMRRTYKTEGKEKCYDS